MEKSDKITAIDLFSGCGGFSLGMEKAGFDILAAIDFNEEAIKVYRENISKTSQVLCKDLTQFPPEDLAEIIKTDKVDVIFGGPPCQGFSNLRKRDGANHGPKLIEDKRRHLYEEFLKYVKYFKPSVFVMENVPGIRTASFGEYYKKVQSKAREQGYRILGVLVSANDFGVPQKRRRQLIVGTRIDLPVYFNQKRHLDDFKTKNKKITLGMAICDLPSLKAGEGTEIAEYDKSRREQYIKKYGSWYLFEVLNVDKSPVLTSHIARPHSDRDIEDFSALREGENCEHAIKRGATFRCPYNMTYFKDRYTRQSRDNLCSTIVAHMSKDGLMFIHPDQDRSLTPREAARIQSFPDTFLFPVPRTHQYRLIGNAVPPLVAESIGKAIKKYLVDVDTIRNNSNNITDTNMPSTPIEMSDILWNLVKVSEDKKALKSLTTEQFKIGWAAFCYLYPSLHPDGILDSKAIGISREACLDIQDDVRLRYPKLSSPYYVISGCPEALVNIVKEANRRYSNGELNQDDYYNNYSLLSRIAYKSTNFGISNNDICLNNSDKNGNILVKQYTDIVKEELL